MELRRQIEKLNKINIHKVNMMKQKMNKEGLQHENKLLQYQLRISNIQQEQLAKRNLSTNANGEIYMINFEEDKLEEEVERSNIEIIYEENSDNEYFDCEKLYDLDVLNEMKLMTVTQENEDEESETDSKSKSCSESEFTFKCIEKENQKKPMHNSNEHQSMLKTFNESENSCLDSTLIEELSKIAKRTNKNFKYLVTSETDFRPC